jgi:hypothetical protein
MLKNISEIILYQKDLGIYLNKFLVTKNLLLKNHTW